jgi:Phosphoesterase family
VSVRSPQNLTVYFCALAWLALGCRQGGSAPASTVATDGATNSAPPICSQMHRDVSRWQGTEIADCGPDVSGLLELSPIGNDWLLVRRRFSPLDDLWSLSPQGVPGAEPTSVDQVMDAATAGFTLLPGSPPRVLVYDPRQSQWNLYVTESSPITGAILASAGEGQWPTGYWSANNDGLPWNHQFVGLENGNVLDRDLGDGSTRIWTVVASADATSPTALVPSTRLVAGPQEQFRRGHRLVHLGPNRLLEWLPRPCASRTAPSDPCAGSDFNVWSYALEDGAALNFQIVSGGFWPDLGDESDVAADGEHLFVWTRATGRLRSYAIDPTLADPLGESPIADPPANTQLASQDWDPPTSAPAIKHLVVILQDGRSFDSYFGHYCQSPPGTGTPPPCTSGAACCEAIPAAVPGAAACTDPESDTSYQPDASPECLRAKMGVAMDGFAIAHPPEACGDPRDFACALAGPGQGGAAIYQGLAGGGALADRYFQTYAFEDGVAPGSEPDPLIENLLYLVSSRFASYFPSLIDSPLLTKELVRLQVAWAIYAGPIDLSQLASFGVPIYYDPDWFPFRSLNGGELEHDIAVGALPAVAVVLPDRGDPARSEAPGQPFDPGIGYTQSLVKAIAASPYQDDTLVLVTHLTAGGFYDHVPPPSPPPLSVDASSDMAALATAIHYGPRVPFLALGKFARSGTVSHAQLELSSVTRFVEWNWMHGVALKGIREGNDLRRYRDTAVNNLGSLIDGTAAGIDVPSGSD